MTTRKILIAKVHTLAKQLDYDEATYRTVLLTQTGKSSCRDMDFRQLSQLANALESLIKGRPMPGGAESRPANLHRALGKGQLLPTPKQWSTLDSLSRRAGWTGLKDFRLLGFARHTVKVAELGELSRGEMTKVITGLLRMLSQTKAKTKSTPHSSLPASVSAGGAK